MFQTIRLWRQIILSVILNWVLGPFVSAAQFDCYILQLTNQIMLAIAWATLPDLPSYREGVIMVGLARQVHNLLASALFWMTLIVS